MLVTLSGIVISVKLLQSEKALSPMLVTPSGIVILLIFSLFERLNPFIPVTFLPSISLGIIITSSQP